jgi:anti-sigma B factor antagonist
MPGLDYHATSSCAGVEGTGQYLASLEGNLNGPPQTSLPAEPRDEGQAAVSASAGLTVRDVDADGEHTLVLAGELDIASAPILEATVASLCDNGSRAIVLDLSELTFMDSTGLRAVLAADKLCSGNGQRFSLAGASGAVERLFELTGVTQALHFEPERPAAEDPS